jgi:hypothetical protein
MSARPRAARRREKTVAERVLSDDAATLLDIVDNVLSKGVVLTGDLMIGLSHVDLIYARISLLLCAADQVMPGEDPDPVRRLQDRHAMRVRARRLGAARRAAAGRGGRRA